MSSTKNLKLLETFHLSTLNKTFRRFTLKDHSNTSFHLYMKRIRKSFCTKIEGLVSYDDFLAERYGAVLTDEHELYDIVLNGKSLFPNLNTVHPFYFVNGEKILQTTYNQILDNLNNRESKILNRLISFGDTNGAGKTQMLNVLPLRIKAIPINDKLKKIVYPPLIKSFDYKNSVIQTFIYSILESLRPFFSEEIKTDIIYNINNLTVLSEYITDYISEDLETSKKAWLRIKNKYYLSSGEEMSYVKPDGAVIIFRIDEIGQLGESSILSQEEEELNLNYMIPKKKS